MISKTNHIVGINDLRSLIQVIQSKYEVDFSHYAMSSLQRRVVRILEVFNLENVDQLIEKIVDRKDFFETVVEEITVNTTEMFRDPSMWAELSNELHSKLKDNSTIRIWHAGCSSGEEIYSMAILLDELGYSDKVKVFATDINDKVLETAKKGHYPIKKLDVNKANYYKFNPNGSFSKYYTDDGKFMKMNPELVDSVYFKNHNLTTLESFSKFDIILCRNVMIYFDKVLQDKVFNLFHKSLYRYGVLVIGARESMVWCSISNKFRLINDKERLYQKIID